MAVTTANTAVNNSSTVKQSTAKPGYVSEKDPNKDRDTFLLLLTTQLKNQDPTSPADTNQVTQQIAALSSVEQQTKTNTDLSQLVDMLGISQANEAVNYIGRAIDADGNDTQLTGGKAYMTYTLPAGASTAEVSISDKSGKVVYTGTGTTIAGRNVVIWDGTNKTTGAAMPAGAYTFAVTAKNAEGKEVKATTITSGVVNAVDIKDGKRTLSLGDISVPLDKVLSVYSAGKAA